jgi:putative nucleotidyltransferase with HDIG domain
MQTVKTTQLQEGMITASPVMTKKGLLIVDEGITLTNASIARIAFYDVNHIEIEDYEEPQKDTNDNSLEPTYFQRITASKEFQDFKAEHSAAADALKESVSSVISQEKEPQLDLLCRIIEPLLAKTTSSIELFDFLHNMRTNDDSIYAHSINVALISNMLGRWLKLSDDNLTILTAAALLHDIGKTKIPAEILNKPGRYTDEEFDLVRRHPSFGYELLLPFEQLDPRIKNAALMHHERCDGHGYPNGMKFHDIDDCSQIIAIADVYDAMTAARSYRAPLCPFQVIADFELEGLQKYNPKFILTFLERIAYTYQNNRVMLTDGRKANIIMLNKQFLSRPIVGVATGTIDLSKTPDLRIQALL